MATVAATANGYGRSDFVAIVFTIKSRGAGSDGTSPTAGEDSAKLRIPWILDQWNLIDLQVNARTRVVESTLMNATAPQQVLPNENTQAPSGPTTGGPFPLPGGGTTGGIKPLPGPNVGTGGIATNLR